LTVAAVGLLGAAGCMVGPAYTRPSVPSPSAWIEAQDPALRSTTGESERWWEVFNDPALGRLVDTAFEQNLSLRAAGLRVLQAQARRGIAIGGLFPQQQTLGGSYTRARLSENTATSVIGIRDVNNWRAGFDTLWEIDVWGRIRRAIESADAQLLAAVASYDDVLVSLIAEVAATYVQIRVSDERLAVARDNVGVQQDSLRIADVRFQAGGTTERDVQQARALLHDTEATIPQLEILRRQSIDSLSVLLGLPPTELTDFLTGPARVPDVPPTVAVAIPADLLRRRPDVRSAEQAAAAQSALIGVAVADLLPTFQLTGSVGLSAEQAAHFFEGRSFEAMAGPAFSWPILNYGRLINNVRLQDATFQELAVNYANTVLVAEREVEDALVGYLRGNDQVARLAESVDAANRAVELSLIQYREGATDYTSVLNTQQAKLHEDDSLASTRGSVALSVIALYKALGGGWEIRADKDFVPDETREEMGARTWWGRELSPVKRAGEIERARADSGERPWWSWRWWWPLW
jgi:NodT family efflux transporter outer membrane factor (OMF) lipoprotein